MVADELLRRDVRALGEMLGAVIAEQAGPAALELVERTRRLARERRQGSAVAGEELTRLIARLSVEDARTVTRAFTMYFDLANLAEDRHRVRVLREREQGTDQIPVSESIAAAISELREHGLEPAEVQNQLQRLAIDLVFTAHPSEAKRSSIRAKLRRMRSALQELDRSDLLPRESQALADTIRAELSILWQTEFVHPRRPGVLDEVDRGVATFTRLWEVVPLVYQRIRQALAKEFPEARFEIPNLLRFGCWMGGDRDGNPHVTWETTERTLCRLRNAAIQLHLDWCVRLSGYLTISMKNTPQADRLDGHLSAASGRWPDVQAEWSDVDAGERYRRWLRTIQWRLSRSFAENLNRPLPAGAYRNGDDLSADIYVICECLHQCGDDLVLEQELRRWHDLARTFGLHLARLDIRQSAEVYHEVAAEILRTEGQCVDFLNLDEENRCRVLTETLDQRVSIPDGSLSPLALDTLQLNRLLHRAASLFGHTCLGGSIVSLTRQASDIVIPFWLWRRTAVELPLNDELCRDAGLRIVPLFEHIEDLRRAPRTLRELLEHPSYRASLQSHRDRQWVMIGYSDSTKDGGYVAANWGLYHAQSSLYAVAAELGVEVTFFHGRGGSLGRGGGPAARGILSLPPESLDGTLRLTEQGEVLAERYDDPQIAYRHLEQVLWAVITGSAVHRPKPPPSWLVTMDYLATRSMRAYRELVEEPVFVRYFETATPIDEIEELPIASRPPRRSGDRSLSDLRAIPWVFAWTQNRCLIPAWYGLGTALSESRARPESWNELKRMYREWPFFEAMIENASLALAKVDLYVAGRYAQLDPDVESRNRIWHRIESELLRTSQAVLELTGRDQLLSNTPWFQRSIEVRNPYVDPLNLIQIEFLRRKREEQSEAVHDLLRLTVHGIAAGMRTTG